MKKYFVCVPGHNVGSGWVEGRIVKERTDSPTNPTGGWIVWPEKSFGNVGSCGIYQRALRGATEGEIKAYESGVYNIKDIIKTELYDIY